MNTTALLMVLLEIGIVISLSILTGGIIMWLSNQLEEYFEGTEEI